MLVWNIPGNSLLIYFRKPIQLLQSHLVFHPQKTERHLLAHLHIADTNLPWRAVCESSLKSFSQPGTEQLPDTIFTWIVKDHWQFPWHTEWLDIYSCTKIPVVLFPAAHSMPASWLPQVTQNVALFPISSLSLFSHSVANSSPE